MTSWLQHVSLYVSLYDPSNYLSIRIKMNNRLYNVFKCDGQVGQVTSKDTAMHKNRFKRKGRTYKWHAHQKGIPRLLIAKHDIW